VIRSWNYRRSQHHPDGIETEAVDTLVSRWRVDRRRFGD
jgi:hypothetical protein